MAPGTSSRPAVSRQTPRLWLAGGVRWYEHLAADAFVLSYPKCGRTWIRSLLGTAIAVQFGADVADPSDLQALTKRRRGVPRTVVKHDEAPQYHTAGELATDRSRYRRKRVILVVRDPRDVIVSYYHHLRFREDSFAGSLSAFIREPVGSIDTLLAYYAVWERERLVPTAFLQVRYEDVHTAPGGELSRMLDFLGLPPADDHVLETAVERCSFANMRRLELSRQAPAPRMQPGKTGDEKGLKTRTGKVGGYREYLGNDDLEYVESLMRKRLSPVYGYLPCRQLS